MRPHSVVDELRRILRDARSGRPTPAADAFRLLIEREPALTLVDNAQLVAEVLQAFHWLPKFHAEFSQAVGCKIPASSLTPPPPPSNRSDVSRPQPESATAPANNPTSTPNLPPERVQLRERLRELSERRLFQWATFYRDAIFAVCDRFASFAENPAALDNLIELLRIEFEAHAADIFQKGADYNSQYPETAVYKNLNGLERFLDLPVAYYLSQTTGRVGPTPGKVYRDINSAILAGVLSGFARTNFGKEYGSTILPKDGSSRRWAHSLAFLTAGDLREVIGRLDRGPLGTGILESMFPIAEATDRLLAESGQFLLPVIGEYRRDRERSRRLDLDLSVPQATDGTTRVTIHCYLDHAAIDREQIEESAARGVTFIVAPLRADLQAWADATPLLRDRVINSVLSDGENGVSVAEAVYRRLKRELATLSTDGPTAILPYNYVRDFPIKKASAKRGFLVHRPSVRDLLHTFERHTGAHLWCSVRRSGKTTSGFDLSATTGNAVVVTQTCDSTGERDGDDTFYRTFTRALSAREQLPEDFFEAAVRKSASGLVGDPKIVFVLDEYETLFGQLRLAEEDPALRYRVAQPLLNQMVKFSRDHLLVLLGMRPDAHFVLMDQNQLSPLVVQNQFPLFAHQPGAETSEFRELLQKACRLSGSAIDTGFSDAMYAETGGHPVLTVNLLYEIFAWLIATRRPARGLRLTEDDFRNFARNGLTEAVLKAADSYDTMRHAVLSGLADSARRTDSWHHAVYVVLGEIARMSPDSLVLTRSDAVALIRRNGLHSRGGNDPDDLLRTAAQANVFHIDGDLVRPRIPLLARLAACIKPSIEA